ncbi:RsmB/NOP family class I SAM-dependent RNA methyltransferase [Succinimonas sp.]|uniref:RsmB/NOP family class I SAM-dependent RNA methyltransferase n=1 Tax=Succinimonas sp. TaxID=1936151 RepID=UPI00386EE65A
MASYSLSDFKIRLIYSIITAVFEEGRALDKAYAIYFKKLKLENEEQALIVSLVNDVFRRLNYYTYVAGYKRIKDIKKHVNKIICVIHLVHKWPVPRGLQDCDDFSIKDARARMEEADKIPNLKYGCPVWLDEFGKKELGERWETEKPCFAKEPRRFIRANTLKTTREELRNMLAAEKVKTRECALPDALEVLDSSAIFKTEAFKKGLFEQQDIGSQEIPLFLDPQPGNKVIDACAGAGGKTLYLSALMKGKGSIIAMDDKDWKLNELKLRARKAGAHNIETRLIDTTKVIKRQHGKADCVLLDVPCSGSGVLKRNPESKWTDSTDSIRELTEIQTDILNRYSKMTKVGGILVYSTCSIFPCEDHNQIAAFLEHNPDFELVAEKTVYPSQGGDGFYMAKLKRLDNSRALPEENPDADTKAEEPAVADDEAPETATRTAPAAESGTSPETENSMPPESNENGPEETVSEDNPVDNSEDISETESESLDSDNANDAKDDAEDTDNTDDSEDANISEDNSGDSSNSVWGSRKHAEKESKHKDSKDSGDSGNSDDSGKAGKKDSGKKADSGKKDKRKEDKHGKDKSNKGKADKEKSDKNGTSKDHRKKSHKDGRDKEEKAKSGKKKK